MAALRDLPPKRSGATGSYTITSKGVNTSGLNLGAAISKAQTIATRIQKQLEPGEDLRSIYIRKLGDAVVARIDVSKTLIATYVAAGTKS